MSRKEKRERQRLADLAALAAAGLVPDNPENVIQGTDPLFAAAVTEAVLAPSLPPVVETVQTLTSGLRLFQALERSSFLRMAALPFNDYLVVSNGRRMWTTDSKLEPMLAPLNLGFEELSSRDNWHPVVGSETGLRLG